LVSIWQTGNGIAADENNNIFFETAESAPGRFDLPQGGATYSNSVLKIDPDTLTLNSYVPPADFFTPWSVAFLNANDLDLSASGILILPDLDGATPHELVAGGKEGIAYVIDRDNMGGYSAAGDQVLQEIALVPQNVGPGKPPWRGDVWFSSPAYWNNTVYFTPNASPILAYPLSSGPVPLGTPVTTAEEYVGAHSPSVSANGTTNGIVWAISGNNLYAFNAATMQQIYASNTLKSRDALPPVAHYVTQTVANGKVYVATQTTLSVYGLLPAPTLVSGAGQSATVNTTLPVPIQWQIVNPYTGAPVNGVTVNFSSKLGALKLGTFSPASAVSGADGIAGNVSTTFTFGKQSGVYTITANAPSAGSATVTETGLPGPPKGVGIGSGNGQSGSPGTVLPNPLTVKVSDSYGNGVPGITVTFTDESGLGVLNPPSAATNAKGVASTSYQLPSTPGTYKISAVATGAKGNALFTETAN